jgi:hypothetical protein
VGAAIPAGDMKVFSAAYVSSFIAKELLCFIKL